MPSLEHLVGVVRDFQEEAELQSRVERLLADSLVKAKTLAAAWGLGGSEELTRLVEEAYRLVRDGSPDSLEKAGGLVDEACREAAARAIEALTGSSLEPDECAAPVLGEAVSRLAGLEGPVRRVAAALLIGPAGALSTLAARAGEVVTGEKWGEFIDAARSLARLLGELGEAGVDAYTALREAAAAGNPLEAALKAGEVLGGLAAGLRQALSAIGDAEKTLEFCWDEAPAEACERLAEERLRAVKLVEGLRGARLGLSEAAEAARRLSQAASTLRKTLRMVRAVMDAMVEAGLTSIAAEMLMRLMEEGRVDLARLTPAEAEAVLTLCRRGLARCTATLR